MSLGRLICPEGHVSSLNKPNPTWIILEVQCNHNNQSTKKLCPCIMGILYSEPSGSIFWLHISQGMKLISIGFNITFHMPTYCWAPQCIEKSIVKSLLKHKQRKRDTEFIREDHLFDHFDGLVQDCNNSSALAMELLQSWGKPSIYGLIMPHKESSNFGTVMWIIYMLIWVLCDVYVPCCFPIMEINTKTTLMNL